VSVGEPVETPAPAAPAAEFSEAIAEAIDGEMSALRRAPEPVKRAFTSCMQLMLDNKIAGESEILGALPEVLYWFQNIGFPDYDYEVLCDVYANVLRGSNLDPPLAALIRAQWCTEGAKRSLMTYSPEWSVDFSADAEGDPVRASFSGSDAVRQLDLLLCGSDVSEAQKDFLIDSRSLDLYYLFSDFPNDPSEFASAEDVYFFNAFAASLAGETLEPLSEDDLLDIYVAGKVIGRPKPSRGSLVSAIALLAGSAALLRVAATRLKR
jgi:hypothetical protein